MAQHPLIRYCVAAVLVASAAWSGDRSDFRRGRAVDAILQDLFPTVDDEALVAAVGAVMGKVVTASGNPDRLDFTVRILNDANPNAFSAAGGYIYVTSGLLRSLRTRDELAAVLAHEVGHVNSRDPNNPVISERQALLISLAIYAGTQFAVAAVGSAYEGSAGADPSAAGKLQQLTDVSLSHLSRHVMTSIYNGYSAKREYRADALALEYARKAGYKPRALEQVLTRLLRSGRAERLNHPVAYLHSSPQKLAHRIEKLRE